MTDAPTDAGRAPGFYWVRSFRGEWLVGKLSEDGYLHFAEDEAFYLVTEFDFGAKLEPPIRPRMSKLAETLRGFTDQVIVESGTYDSIEHRAGKP